MDLTTATDALGCPALVWTRPQVTVRLTHVHTGIPTWLVQQDKTSSTVLAPCPPGSSAMAVIKMFPSTAQKGDKQYSCESKKQSLMISGCYCTVRQASPMAGTEARQLIAKQQEQLSIRVLSSTLQSNLIISNLASHMLGARKDCCVLTSAST